MKTVSKSIINGNKHASDNMNNGDNSSTSESASSNNAYRNQDDGRPSKIYPSPSRRVTYYVGISLKKYLLWNLLFLIFWVNLLVNLYASVIMNENNLMDKADGANGKVILNKGTVLPDLIRTLDKEKMLSLEGLDGLINLVERVTGRDVYVLDVNLVESDSNSKYNNGAKFFSSVQENNSRMLFDKEGLQLLKELLYPNPDVINANKFTEIYNKYIAYMEENLEKIEIINMAIIDFFISKLTQAYREKSNGNNILKTVLIGEQNEDIAGKIHNFKSVDIDVEKKKNAVEKFEHAKEESKFEYEKEQSGQVNIDDYIIVEVDVEYEEEPSSRKHLIEDVKENLDKSKYSKFGSFDETNDGSQLEDKKKCFGKNEVKADTMLKKLVNLSKKVYHKTKSSIRDMLDKFESWIDED